MDSSVDIASCRVKWTAYVAIAPQVTYFVNSPEELERIDVDETDDDDDGNAKVWRPRLLYAVSCLVRCMHVLFFRKT